METIIIRPYPKHASIAKILHTISSKINKLKRNNQWIMLKTKNILIKRNKKRINRNSNKKEEKLYFNFFKITENGLNQNLLCILKDS